MTIKSINKYYCYAIETEVLTIQTQLFGIENNGVTKLSVKF